MPKKKRKHAKININSLCESMQKTEYDTWKRFKFPLSELAIMKPNKKTGNSDGISR